MLSPSKLLAMVSTGAFLIAFTALGLADPGDGASAQKAAGNSASPAQAILERSGCAHCSATAGGCCADASRNRAPGTVLLAQGNPGSAEAAAPQQKSKAQPAASKAALAKGVAVRKALLDQVSTLMEDGAADCCTQPGCVFCPIAADACGCAGSLAKGGPVCPECWGGWQAGQGMLPDVKPESVKILPSDVLKKVYGMKAERLDQAGTK